MSIGIMYTETDPSITRVRQKTVTAYGLRNDARIKPFMRDFPEMRMAGRDRQGDDGGTAVVHVRSRTGARADPEQPRRGGDCSTAQADEGGRRGNAPFESPYGPRED